MSEGNQDCCVANHELLLSSVKCKDFQMHVWLLQHTRSRHWHRSVHNQYKSQCDAMGECTGCNICRSLSKSNLAHLTHLFAHMDHFKFRSWQIDVKKSFSYNFTEPSLYTFSRHTCSSKVTWCSPSFSKTDECCKGKKWLQFWTSENLWSRSNVFKHSYAIICLS